MSLRPDQGPQPVQPGTGPVPAPACDVFYLRTEPYRDGFRWVIAQSGLTEPVLIGASVHPSDRAARIAGRDGLERFLTQQNSRIATRDPF